jgi:hypothetical protein
VYDRFGLDDTKFCYFLLLLLLWFDEETVSWADLFSFSLRWTFSTYLLFLVLDGVEWLCEAVLVVV